MNSTSTSRTPEDRRAFLRNAVTLITATIAVATSVKSSARSQQTKDLDSPDTPSKGYQDTEHVRTYYEKARF